MVFKTKCKINFVTLAKFIIYHNQRLDAAHFTAISDSENAITAMQFNIIDIVQGVSIFELSLSAGCSK